MKLLKAAIFFLALGGILGIASAQVSNPSIIVVASAPSGSCTVNLPDQQVIMLGTLYSCQSGTWAMIGSGGGSYLPISGGTLTGNLTITPATGDATLTLAPTGFPSMTMGAAAQSGAALYVLDSTHGEVNFGVLNGANVGGSSFAEAVAMSTYGVLGWGISNTVQTLTSLDVSFNRYGSGEIGVCAGGTYGCDTGSMIGANFTATSTVSAAQYFGPATAPTGSCSTNGVWVFSQDGHATFCASGTWTTKI